MVLTGDTIKLTVKFKNYNEEYTNVDNVQCTIYSASSKNILKQFSTTDINNVGTGLYECFYVVPTEDFIFEYKGQYNGKVLLNRQVVKVDFTK